MPKALLIEIASDVVCPWCYIGKRRLEKARVSEQEERVRGLGISGVPTFVFERKTGVSGAYPPENLAQIIRDVAAK